MNVFFTKRIRGVLTMLVSDTANQQNVLCINLTDIILLVIVLSDIYPDNLRTAFDNLNIVKSTTNIRSCMWYTTLKH